MSTADWIFFSIPLVLVWVPALLFLTPDLIDLTQKGVRKFKHWRQTRRLERLIESENWAYRELELKEPKRPRLGIPYEEEE